MEMNSVNMGGGGAMPQGQPMHQQQSILRPQSQNQQQQLYAMVMETMRKNPAAIGGWQHTFDIAQRAARVMQLVTALRMLNPNDVNRCMSVAQTFESRILMESATQDQYVETMRGKMGDIHAQRQQRAQQQAMMSGNMNVGMDMQRPPSQMNQPQGNPGFPAHLQHPMHLSPLPQQPQSGQQPGKGPGQGSLDPSLLQGVPHALLHMPNPQLQPPQQAPGPQQHVQQQEIIKVAAHMYNNTTQQHRDQLREQYLSKLSDEQRSQQLQPGKGDPLQRHFIHLAQQTFMNRQKSQPGFAPPKQPGIPPQMGNNANGGPHTGQPDGQNPGAGLGGIDYSAFAEKQAMAAKLQGMGEQVVPASNNTSNVGVGQQQNVMGAINPQLMNQMNDQQNSQNAQNQMQQLIARQQMQQRAQQQQQQNHMRQQQALQQAITQRNGNALQGQPGGLGGPINSPAMNMLNRPMNNPPQNPRTPQPQNKSMPSDPQQMTTVSTGHPTPQVPNIASQQYQALLDQNMKTQQSFAAPGLRPMQFPSEMPDQMKQRLANMPLDQVQNLLLQWQRQQEQRMHSQMLQQQTQQALHPQTSMGGGPGFSHAGPGGMMIGMNNVNNAHAIPNFNTAPPPNQQQHQPPPQMMPGLDPQQQLMNTLADTQLRKRRQEAMDLAHYPKSVLTNLQISVPMQVQTWGRLRMHLMRNQHNIQKGTLEKMQQLQHDWYQHNPQMAQTAMKTLEAMQKGQNSLQSAQNAPNGGLAGSSGMSGPPTMGLPPMPNGGPAPPAQMVPQPQLQQPIPPGQQPLNMGAGRPLPPIAPASAVEVTNFRAKYQIAHTMSDDQIQAAIMQRKMRQLQMQVQHNPAMLQQAQQQALIRAQQAQQAQMNNQQRPGGRPQPPSQGGNGMLDVQQQLPQIAAPQLTPQQSSAGQKRPVDNEVIEIPNPNMTQNRAVQAPPMQPTRSAQQQGASGPQRIQMPSQEQLKNMTEEQRILMRQRMGQIEAMKKAQADAAAIAVPGNEQQQPAPSMQQQSAQAQQQKLLADRQRLKQMFNEVQNLTTKGDAIEINREGILKAQEMLKRLAQPMSRIDATYSYTLNVPELGEARVREIMRLKTMYLQNCSDLEGNIKDYLSITLQGIAKMEATIRQYFSELKRIRERLQGGGHGQSAQVLQQPPQQQQRPPQQQSPDAKPQQAPQVARAPSPQGPGKKSSSSSDRPPAAPTSEKKFEWGAPSPQGVPKYEPRYNELTPDKLKFPPTKKTKIGNGQQGSPAITPAQQDVTSLSMGASPGIVPGKAPSPEQIKKISQQGKQEVMDPAAARIQRFRCPDTTCEGSITGFDGEEELRDHRELFHSPVEDPLAFMLEMAALACGVDADGNPKPKTKEKGKAPAQQPRIKRSPQTAASKSKRSELTPNFRPEGVTPAAVATPGGAGTPASTGKAKARASPTSAKRPLEATEQLPFVSKTVRETLAERAGFTLPSAPKGAKVREMAELTTSPGPGSASTLHDSDDDFMNMLHESFGNDSGAIDGWLDLEDSDLSGQDVDWGLPSSSPAPAITPSDQYSDQGRASDLGEHDRLMMTAEWDPFGYGPMEMPDALKMQQLELRPKLAAERAGKGKAKETDADGDEEMEEMEEPEAGAGAEAGRNSDQLYDWDAIFGASSGLQGVLD